MKAILLDGFGGPEVMRLGEATRPEPGEGEVRIKVAATSVNRADTVQRRGNYPPPPGASEILGLEAAGVVDRVGPGVTHWRPGDRVMALLTGGGYAEYALADAGHLMAVPEAMDLETAAAIPEVYITAFLNLFLIGGLSDGDTVLLHGGGGGVNTAAIQICRALLSHCRILVTASPGKIARVKALGADRVIDYRNENFAEVVRDFTGGAGADVILDHIGADYLAKNQAALAVQGRLVVIGLMGGATGQINLGIMMVKRQRIIGSVLRALPKERKTAIVTVFTERVLPHIAQGDCRPLIHRALPLAAAADAHAEMEASGHFGKIVLQVS
ncbi:NAD(P)H-quinone oxidoreductase [Desulfatitalea alkaliphila]|uniref:NAD(P)H-quinone oxidoreductase n=1 Tax=Desulfatitalea alkaliphila TaxID=2929485 RepID=A0AA41R215_9BACT|nr:NAD(P)H-quinone oxidoreductase [Desulfatitalea alkaliphila]MCJ8499795.1 NAD(P)H-quinone oxidoreductase [Desulfatitalea alkaliphila]